MTDIGMPVWKRMPTSPTPVSDECMPIVVVGAGPVGLTIALDLARRGHRVVVLNRLDCVPAGSKAICFSKRSIEIFDRLGVGESIVKKGIHWNVGKVFWKDRPEAIYQFDLQPTKNECRPAFVNIQQYHVEARLVEALESLPNVEIRWGHEVLGVCPTESFVRLRVRSGGDEYLVSSEYLVACDGCRSTIRRSLGLEFQGRAFEDRFLIADIQMHGERPLERWFWFEPPFNGARSALLHKQPDGTWRLDFQLGPADDLSECIRPENIARYVRAMLGADVEFTPVWCSVYTFQCRRMANFIHGRTVFAGDSAHVVSPFGARGCNGGLADADNLGWKLDLVLRRRADRRLLISYEDETIVAADENILHSSRSTDFMTPRSGIERAFRDAVLELSAQFSFARPFVNSGRLSTPASYPDSTLNTSDVEVWNGGVKPGSPAVDAPMGRAWLLSKLGDAFVLLCDGWNWPPLPNLGLIDLATLTGDLGILRSRYALSSGGAYLIRPDQYVAARWQRATAAAVSGALARAHGFS
jgi:3-(3-hydroxy-phenyl)propionate hydroxylase